MTMEVIMAYAARPSDFHHGVVAAQPAIRVPRPGLLMRIFDALLNNRSHRAERDVAAFLARRGYRITDSIEREMNERMFRGDWNSPR
jgi:hypothetical protein